MFTDCCLLLVLFVVLRLTFAIVRVRRSLLAVYCCSSFVDCRLLLDGSLLVVVGGLCVCFVLLMCSLVCCVELFVVCCCPLLLLVCYLLVVL